MTFSITLFITVATVIVSLLGFNNRKVIDDLIFYGPAISQRNQYYRFITHGFIHADFMHLAFNMLAFYSFGNILENHLFADDAIFGENAKFYFAVLYFGGLILASIPDYSKHKNDYHYRSLGASGAVASVIFASIVLYPNMPISLMFLPGIPGWIFGILYIIISAYLDRQGGGNINHGAHLWGAIFGIVFVIIFAGLNGHINLWENFIHQIRN